MTNNEYFKNQLNNIKLLLKSRVQNVKAVFETSNKNTHDINIYCKAYTKATEEAINAALDCLESLNETIKTFEDLEK